MKIAILGAGFAGLAAALNLLKQKPFQVTVIAEGPIGSGASGVAAGLLHPFANVHSKLSRYGYEGFDASLKLLDAAGEALGKKPYDDSGILRPALHETQQEEYFAAAAKHPEDIDWLTPRQMEAKIPGVMKAPGIFIKRGVTVYPDDYLRGLWLAAEKLGAIFEQRRITSLDELSGYDRIVVAMGAQTCQLKELAHLPLRYTKGQILELLWPENLPPLPLALNARIYCVMLPDGKRCLAGSTYEKQFLNAAADPAVAQTEILPKLEALYPPLKGCKILDCRAGIRVSTPQHLPLIKQVNERCFVMTGFGSKGLLYHALYAQKLVDLMNAS